MPPEFTPFYSKMKNVGMEEVQIEAFRRHYQRALIGEKGKLGKAQFSPLSTCAKLENLEGVDKELLDKVAILKLNGGLATSMGLEGAKSLLRLKGNLTFLDILIKQVKHFRAHFNARLPLILMNSLRTDKETKDSLEQHLDDLDQCVPNSFVQSFVPKILEEDFTPAFWPQNPDLEWCPPGHGDVFLSLSSLGILDKLIDSGFEYLFMSNIDNLGAVMDMRIPSWMHRDNIPFVMEVARRTESDRKGGHLAVNNSGRVILREIAQCPEDELDDFQNVQRFCYFNTNSLWVNLKELKKLTDENSNLLELPLIVNRKTLDPRDPQSPKILQLETAMGSCITLFEGARALEVPRKRFAPVKNLADLLAVSSDAYKIMPNYCVSLDPSRTEPPVIQLPEEIRTIDDFFKMFPNGAPSLIECSRLTLKGPVVFGKGVRCVGKVTLEMKASWNIPESTVLSDKSTDNDNFPHFMRL